MILVYLHGFLSSVKAKKAMDIKHYLKEHKLTDEYKLYIPDYGDTPKEAYEYLYHFFKKLNNDAGEEHIAVIGSSLGGFFATLMQHKFNYPIALINPCVHPQKYFESLIGPQHNPATGMDFVLDREMMKVLIELDSKIKIHSDERTLVLLQTADEVLNYQDAINFYTEASIDIREGGSHAYDNFASKIPQILDFFKANLID